MRSSWRGSREEAAALSAISLQLARETELGDIVRTVLERALGLVGGRFGQILLTEGSADFGELVVHYTTNTPPRELGLRFSVRDSVSGLALQARKPVIVPDVERADYWIVTAAAADALGNAAPRITEMVAEKPRYQRVLEREKERVRAEFAAPLIAPAASPEGEAAGSVVGVLNVETPREEGFDELQRERLTALGRLRGETFCEALDHSDGAALRTLLDEALLIGGTTFGQLLEIDGEQLIIVATTGGEPIGTRVALADSVSGEAAASESHTTCPTSTPTPAITGIWARR